MTSKFKHLPPLTDDEEAEIQRQIALDPHDYESSDDDLRKAKPFAEVFPELAANIRRARGRPRTEQTKQPVKLRLDPDVIAKFKASGPGWQTRINEVLKAAKVPR